VDGGGADVQPKGGHGQEVDVINGEKGPVCRQYNWVAKGTRPISKGHVKGGEEGKDGVLSGRNPQGQNTEPQNQEGGRKSRGYQEGGQRESLGCMSLNINRQFYDKEKTFLAFLEDEDIAFVQEVGIDHFDLRRFYFNGYDTFVGTGNPTRVMTLVKRGFF
jgi:hypothetical protein